MAIVLFRIDERLIHGQVVIGWAHELHPDVFVLVDDELAGSDWEQDLYRLAAGDMDVRFVSVAEARAQLTEWREAPSRAIVLTRDIATMRRLAAGGLLRGAEVNLGGLHYAEARRELLPYLFVSEADLTELQALRDEGVEVSARDLPDAQRVTLATLMKR